MARLEAKIVCETRLGRFAEICLLAADPPFRDDGVIRGLQALRVGADVRRAKRGAS